MRSTSAERGSVTAELAILLPAITLLFGVIVFTAQLGLTQLRLEDAARAAARQAARGEELTSTVQAAQTIAGPGTTVVVSKTAGYLTVTVSTTARGPFSGLLDWRLSAQASARVEAEPSPEYINTRSPGP